MAQLYAHVAAMASLYQHAIYQLRNSALPLTIFWAGGLSVLSSAELLNWLPRWLLLVVTAPAAFLALLHYLHWFLRLSWVVKTYGRHLPEFMRRMIRLFPKLARFRTETTKVGLHLALASFAFALVATLGVYSVLPLCALLLGIAGTALLRILLPPAGVYLATSSPECIRFFGQLSRRTIPAFAALLDVSNLLDPDGDFKDFYGEALGVLNDYRTTSPDDWPDVVKQLIEMAALVVVDGREQSPGIELEVKRILSNRLEFKTAFLTADGTLPRVLSRLDAKSSHPSGTFLLLTPEDALQAIPVMINQARAFWIPVRTDV